MEISVRSHFSQIGMALLAALAVVGATLILWKTLDSYRTQTISLDSSHLAPPFVAVANPSQETTVEQRVIAQKIDLQRKLIVPDSPQDRVRIEQLVKKSGGVLIEGSGDSLVVELPKENEAAITAQLEEQQLVKSVEVDYPVFLTADEVGWGSSKLNLPPVWPTTKGNGIKVAVLDSGIDYTHSELQGRYAGGYDFVNHDSDPMDDNGHGTHVAGIIASNENGYGTLGASPQVSVVGVKVLSADGTGYVSDTVDGLDWAIKQRIPVINLSLGTTYDSSALREKLDEAAAAGLTVIAAAGNTGGGSMLYPAAYASVISVGATDQNDQLASFSALGAEVTAPGVSINSSVPGQAYAVWSGTSMAAPHVSAAVALMIANGQPNPRARLQQTAVDLGTTGKDIYFGYGRINAQPAVLEKDLLAPVVTFLQPANQSELSGPTTISLDIQDEYPVVSAALWANGQQLAVWSGEPYTTEWDTAAFVGQNITLVAQATDDSGNTGGAQVTVLVANNPTPSPSPLVATPSASPKLSTPSARLILKASPSATLVNPRGSSAAAKVRQDLYTPSQEHRQNLYHAPSELPAVSNADRRNPLLDRRTDETASDSSETEEDFDSDEEENEGDYKDSKSFRSFFFGNRRSKPEVKGASTEQRSVLQRILRSVFAF
jgi:subtilisin family serine protease